MVTCVIIRRMTSVICYRRALVPIENANTNQSNGGNFSNCTSWTSFCDIVRRVRCFDDTCQNVERFVFDRITGQLRESVFELNLQYESMNGTRAIHPKWAVLVQ